MNGRSAAWLNKQSAVSTKETSLRSTISGPRMPQEQNSLPSKAEDLKSSRREKGAGGSSPLVRWSSSRATRSSSFGDWVLPYFVVLGTDAIAAALSQDLLVCLVECCWDTKFTGFPKLQLHITVDST